VGAGKKAMSGAEIPDRGGADCQRKTKRGAIEEKIEIGANAFVYFVTAVISSTISFFLIPIFTRVLTTEEFGIVSIATTATSLLAPIIGLGLGSYVTQMHFRYKDRAEQRHILGSLLLFLIIFSGAIVVGLDTVGRFGYLEFVRGVRFRPYLETALWTAYMTVFVAAAQGMFMARNQSLKMSILLIGVSSVNAVASLTLVLAFGLGVEGYLLGGLIAAVVIGCRSLWILGRESRPNLDWSRVLEGLRFSLPLIPHTIALWVLTLSDRYVLSHFVSTASIGVYSLGYQVGFIVSMITNAVNNSFYPIASGKLSDSNASGSVPGMGTMVVATFALAAVGVACLGPEFVSLLTPERYHGATAVVPWIATGFFFQGLYFILSLGTWFSMKTGWVPIITAFGAAVNVICNLILIPRLGIVGSAISNVLAFSTLAALNGYLAFRKHKIDWEYWQWLKIALIGGICYVVAMRPGFSSHLAALVWRVALIISLFPVLMVVLRVTRLDIAKSYFRMFIERMAPKAWPID